MAGDQQNCKPRCSLMLPLEFTPSRWRIDKSHREHMISQEQGRLFIYLHSLTGKCGVLWKNW